MTVRDSSELLRQVIHHRGLEDLSLAAEVPEEHHFGHTGAGGELFGADRFVPPLAEQLAASGEQPLT